MLVSRRHNGNSPPITMFLKGLNFVQRYKYLLLVSDLSWSQYIEYKGQKTVRPILPLILQLHQSIHQLWQNYVYLHVSLVRSHLEYRAQVWHRHLAKDTRALERSKVWSACMLKGMELKPPGTT